jgi:hypothetical protein
VREKGLNVLKLSYTKQGAELGSAPRVAPGWGPGHVPRILIVMLFCLDSLGLERFKQRSSLVEVAGIESFVEPTINLGQRLSCCFLFPSVLPQVT